MTKVARFVIWICSKFNRVEIEGIIRGLSEVLTDGNPEVKLKDDFQDKHPNYRKFSVDPLPPLTSPIKVKPAAPTYDYKQLLARYQETNGKPLNPVKYRVNSPKIPERTVCPHCHAPSAYLYYNDGVKRTQIRCKVCQHLFQLNKRDRQSKKTKFFCPYCGLALYTWKQRQEVTIYKCGNHNCLHRIRAEAKLNSDEISLREKKSSQFKLCYQYREYHYQAHELVHSAPDKPKIDLSRIHNSANTLGLILSFYVSFAIPARKTAQILRSMYAINVSYQTVLNYAAAAAFYCHSFNFKYKGDIDTFQAGDETYIKVLGKHNYVFFFISAKNLKITAYHLADNRGTQPAITAMQEAIRTAKPGQKLVLITDGNPSYPAGIHFINSKSDINSHLEHHKVIGLQNLDSESETYRPYKELIERLNRTFKYHVKPSAGFGATNGAISLTVLFVTHYNFLRPHMSLYNKPPMQLPELESVATLQGKWAKILQMAA